MLRLLRSRGAAAAAAAAAATAAAVWQNAAAAETKQAAAAAAPLPPVAAHAQKIEEPAIEMLIHNISHSDMVLRVEEDPFEAATGQEARRYLARPQFNDFMPVSSLINEKLKEYEGEGALPEVVSVPSKYRVSYPAGLDLRRGGISPGVELTRTVADDAPSPSAAWRSLHIKGSKHGFLTGRELAERDSSTPRVVQVYLPLLATVLPEWMRAVKKRFLQRPLGTPQPRKVLVLVSGAGQPRDEHANPNDNSTEATGWLMERFVRLVYPEVEVIHIRSESESGIFKYDDNVRFVKKQVLPIVEAKRHEMVQAHGDGWASHLRVTVCLADGAPARISALHAAMRSYRPDYLHVWRTKTFWDTELLSEEDVESHTFKKLEMRPPQHRSQLPSTAEKGLVDEMVRYKRQFEAVRDSGAHELASFWLRKTGKAVLGVLVTRKADGTYTYWRGMNVEVSMPTGTLCAERNAIGNALGDDQSVRRSDMIAIAVLSVSLDPSLEKETSGEVAEVALNPLDPCGACMEWLKKISEVNPDFKVLTFTSTSCEKVFVTPIGEYG